IKLQKFKILISLNPLDLDMIYEYCGFQFLYHNFYKDKSFYFLLFYSNNCYIMKYYYENNISNIKKKSFYFRKIKFLNDYYNIFNYTGFSYCKLNKYYIIILGGSYKYYNLTNNNNNNN